MNDKIKIYNSKTEIYKEIFEIDYNRITSNPKIKEYTNKFLSDIVILIKHNVEIDPERDEFRKHFKTEIENLSQCNVTKGKAIKEAHLNTNEIFRKNIYKQKDSVDIAVQVKREVQEKLECPPKFFGLEDKEF